MDQPDWITASSPNVIYLSGFVCSHCLAPLPATAADRADPRVPGGGGPQVHLGAASGEGRGRLGRAGGAGEDHGAPGLRRTGKLSLL